MNLKELPFNTPLIRGRFSLYRSKSYNYSMRTKDFFGGLVAVLICQAAGLIGSIFTSSAIPTWYSTLEKPALNPPSWVFGPVWTSLYALMGIAAYMIWKKRSTGAKVKLPLGIFAIQLVLNALWSIVFFGFHNPELALVNIALLWLLIVAAIKLFYPISRAAAWLLVPYLAWVSFASYLNYAIAALN